MSDFATDTVNVNSLNIPKADNMKAYLQHLLDGKENQLRQAGILGQRVLAQQMELEERIKQIQDVMEGEGVEEEMRERYRQLADMQLVWDEENATLSSAFPGSKRFLKGTSLPSEEPEPERTKSPLGTAGSSSSAAQSRRKMKTAHRGDDVEFAFEIGSGLLIEVRRLQGLLAERDKTIQDMKEDKDDLERIVESQRTTIGQKDDMIEELRSTNWGQTERLSSARDVSDDLKTESWTMV